MNEIEMQERIDELQNLGDELLDSCNDYEVEVRNKDERIRVLESLLDETVSDLDAMIRTLEKQV